METRGLSATPCTKSNGQQRKVTLPIDIDEQLMFLLKILAPCKPRLSDILEPLVPWLYEAITKAEPEDREKDLRAFLTGKNSKLVAEKPHYKPSPLIHVTLQ